MKDNEQNPKDGQIIGGLNPDEGENKAPEPPEGVDEYMVKYEQGNILKT